MTAVQRAACMPESTDLAPPSIVHSVIFEEDCVFEFEAIGRAQLLHGEILTFDTDFDQEPYSFSFEGSEVQPLVERWQAHVSDRWCPVADVSHWTASVPDDTYSSGAVDWCLFSEPPATITQQLSEYFAEGDDQVLATLCTIWDGSTILNVRTYGHFVVFQGVRDLQLPLESISHLPLHLAQIWADFVDLERISFVVVHPQPTSIGVDLHVIVTESIVPAPTLILLDGPSEGDDLRSVVELRPSDSGFALLVRSGHELIQEARYTLWHDGRAHYGHAPFIGSHGQYWKASASLPYEGDESSLLGTSIRSVEPICQYRPNPDIRIPFDEDLPIVRHTEQGPTVIGRTIPPPNWSESTLYRAASAAGAVSRTAHGQLIVRVRTWAIEHVDGGRYAPRDFTMRAQLLVRLREKIKRVWHDVIGPDDHVGIHVVRPVPFADGDGTRYLPILAEANRPGRCTLQPVLFAVREITALGVDPPDWCACLVPSVFSVADVYEACQPAGEPHQLLVPQGTSQPRWMNSRHTRVANAGLFVPVWWDDRLCLEEVAQDSTSLLQLRDSVIPPWPTLPLEFTSGDEVWFMQKPGPSMSPTLGPVRLYGLRNAIATVTVDNASPLFEQLEPMWPAHLRDYADLHSLHYVASPPAFTSSPQATTYLMRFNDDHFSQVHEDDILALISITMVSPERKQRLRVQWAPCRTTRNGLLEFLRLGWYCQQPDILCFLYLNEVMWPLDDNGIRHLDNGDSIKVQLRSDRFTWCDIAHSERMLGHVGSLCPPMRRSLMKMQQPPGLLLIILPSVAGAETGRDPSGRIFTLKTPQNLIHFCSVQPLGLRDQPSLPMNGRGRLRTSYSVSLWIPMSVTAGVRSNVMLTRPLSLFHPSVGLKTLKILLKPSQLLMLTSRRSYAILSGWTIISRLLALTFRVIFHYFRKALIGFSYLGGTFKMKLRKCTSMLTARLRLKEVELALQSLFHLGIAGSLLVLFRQALIRWILTEPNLLQPFLALRLRMTSVSLLAFTRKTYPWSS